MIHVFQFLQTVFWQNSHFVLVNRVEWLWHQSDSFVIKAWFSFAAELPATWRRHSCHYFLQYRSDMSTEVAGNSRGYVSLYRRHACEVDWVGLRRHAGGKDLRCFLSRRRYVLIRRSSIAGSSGGMWEPGYIIICFCELDGAQRSQSPLLW